MGDISDKLREAYEKKGLSYQELASMCKVPRATIQRYVMGTTDRIDIDKLQAICNVLEIDVALLLGWKKPDDEDSKLNSEIVRLLSRLSPPSKQKAIDYIHLLLISEDKQ